MAGRETGDNSAFARAVSMMMGLGLLQVFGLRSGLKDVAGGFSSASKTGNKIHPEGTGLDNAEPQRIEGHPNFYSSTDGSNSKISNTFDRESLKRLKGTINGEFVAVENGIALFEMDGRMVAFDIEGRKLGFGWLGGDGTEINFTIDAKIARNAGSSAKGSEIMTAIFNSISKNWEEPQSIRGTWQLSLPDNLKTFNRLHFEEDMSLASAAANTFTGKMAKRLGFEGKIQVFPSFPDKNGYYTNVNVTFYK
jgi:hypothetical protein